MAVTAPDTLRVLAIVSLVPAALHHGVIGLALVLLLVGGCMVPRAMAVPAWLDVTFCASAIFAAWAALLDWYDALAWLDIVVHAIFTGLLGLLAWQLLLRSQALAPSASLLNIRLMAVVFTTVSATTLATLWEIGEWLGHLYLDPSIQVGYHDTLSDLAAGILGALAAGIIAAMAVRSSASTPTPTEYAR